MSYSVYSHYVKCIPISAYPTRSPSNSPHMEPTYLPSLTPTNFPTKQPTDFCSPINVTVWGSYTTQQKVSKEFHHIEGNYLIEEVMTRERKFESAANFD